MAGQGHYFWTYGGEEQGGPLDVYTLGAGSTPTATLSFGPLTKLFTATGMLAALQYGVASVDLIQLGTQSPMSKSRCRAPTTLPLEPMAKGGGRSQMTAAF
ncbi:MAG: hypothetical protein FWD17_02775 [Polyangiaceae bacterium]|nr:hypothetical protein [Polyangiaceae bacterium]